MATLSQRVLAGVVPDFNGHAEACQCVSEQIYLLDWNPRLASPSEAPRAG